MDAELRLAERSGDPDLLFRARVRAGTIGMGRVAMLAHCGHASAMEMCQVRQVHDLVTWLYRLASFRAGLATGDTMYPRRVPIVKAVAIAARLALPDWKNKPYHCPFLGTLYMEECREWCTLELTDRWCESPMRALEADIRDACFDRRDGFEWYCSTPEVINAPLGYAPDYAAKLIEGSGTDFDSIKEGMCKWLTG